MKAWTKAETETIVWLREENERLRATNAELATQLAGVAQTHERMTYELIMCGALRKP